MEKVAMDVLDRIYEELYAKKRPSTLERNILKSIWDFKQRPIDRDALSRRIDKNISEYNWLIHKDFMKIIALMPDEFKDVLPDCDKYADTALLEKLLHQIYMMHSILLKQRLCVRPRGRPRKVNKA